MDATSITTLISTVGFPIAVSIAIWASYNKTLKELVDVVSKNNELITRLIDKMED